MTEKKKKAIMNCETFDELLDQEYGSQGSPERNAFETEAEAFCLAAVKIVGKPIFFVHVVFIICMSL